MQDTITRILKEHYICTNPIESPQLININTTNGPIDVNNAIVFQKHEIIKFDENMIDWNFMTLQDAIDFVRYAIDTMRFTNFNKTVGGPIDILVITPKQAKWIAHKELH